MRHTNHTPSHTIVTHINSFHSYTLMILIVSLVIAVIGGLIIYFLFMAPKNERRLSSGALKKLYYFLNCRVFALKGILKCSYVILTLFLLVNGILSLFTPNGGMIFITAIALCVFVRIIYEIVMKFILLVENTSVLRKSITGEGFEETSFDPIESDVDVSDDDFE